MLSCPDFWESADQRIRNFDHHEGLKQLITGIVVELEGIN